MSKFKLIAPAIAALLLAVAVPAQAALPAGVAGLFSDLQADFTDLLNTYLFPTMLVVLGGLLLLRLIKKGSKAVT